MVTITLKPQRKSILLSCSPTVAFLCCTAAVFLLVLGTQFKMMALLGDHHDADANVNTNANTLNPQHASGKGVRRGGQQKQHDTKSLAMKIESALQNSNHKIMTQPDEQQNNDNDNEDQPPPEGLDNVEQDAQILQIFNPADQETELYKSMAASIASRWNLTTPNAIDLLMQQLQKDINDYNPTTDFVHFHHLYKSGGTSISNLMDKTIGLPKSSPRNKWYEGVLPGSYPSGNFDHDEALEDIQTRLAKGTKRDDLPYKASYAHTGLRPVYGPKRTQTGVFLLNHLPSTKKLRVITMLRDPTDFRASNHAMIMCGLNYEVTRFNNERVAKGLHAVCKPKDGLDLSALVDRKISDLLGKCEQADRDEADGKKPKINTAQRKQCTKEQDGEDTLVHCRSASNLLESKQYDKHYRSMFKGLMGRFHRGQQCTNGTAYGRMGYGFERAEESKGYSVETVEEYALQDLGGLDLTISGAGKGGPPEPDFVWFGITERMKESTTLFYYQFKAKPLPQTPIHRVQDCRPNSWWTSKDREIVKEREPADYAVWRVANAIMDVRMEKMKMEIQKLLNKGETKESLYYVDWDQLEEIGVKVKGKNLVTGSSSKSFLSK